MIVLDARRETRRRATILLGLPVAAIVLLLVFPRWWTGLLAALATVQPIAEWVWTHRARLVIHADGVRWEAPWRHFDLSWADIDGWRLRSIGFGRSSPTSTEWMLTVSPRGTRAVRAFVWRTAEELGGHTDALRNLAPDRLGPPEGWPVSPASGSPT